jgi:hypothetical protein
MDDTLRASFGFGCSDGGGLLPPSAEPAYPSGPQKPPAQRTATARAVLRTAIHNGSGNASTARPSGPANLRSPSGCIGPNSRWRRVRVRRSATECAELWLTRAKRPCPGRLRLEREIFAAGSAMGPLKELARRFYRVRQLFLYFQIIVLHAAKAKPPILRTGSRCSSPGSPGAGTHGPRPSASRWRSQTPKSP